MRCCLFGLVPLADAAGVWPRGGWTMPLDAAAAQDLESKRILAQMSAHAPGMLKDFPDAGGGL